MMNGVLHHIADEELAGILANVRDGVIVTDLSGRIVYWNEGASKIFGYSPDEMLGNTAPFDITHHPAMSVPCGMVDGLPVGLMLVGRHFDEMTIYRAAHAFEQAGDWKKM